jgi:serine/threonine protein kinase
MKPLNPDEPRHVGRYRLVAALGEGGMGRVLLGVSPDGRLVAVKQVHPGFAHDDGFRSRFHREVQTSRMVSGAYTAAVMDADPDAPTPWLASMFVAGPSLKEAVEAVGPLPPASVRILAVGLASALTDIHRAGLIHRDLKPSNVLLTDDGARVIDFGIARAAEGDSELTHTGSIIGSPGFMSPEQADGRPVTPASDVFSLGALLVMASTGRAPFGGGSTPQVLYNVVHGRPDLGSLPPELRQLVEPCLAKDPAQRPAPAQILDFLGPVPPGVTPWPPTVHALIGAQKTQVNQVLALPPEPSVAPQEPRRATRRWVWVTAALGAVIVLGAATVVGVRLSTTDHPTEPTAAPGFTHQPPSPYSLDDLREIDPCKLLERDSLPATGPVKPPETNRLFERCGFSTEEGTDKTASRTVDINLYERMTQQGGTPVKINDLPGFKKVDGIYCVVAIENPFDRSFAMTASSGRENGDPCATPTEAMSAILLQMSYGTEARYQLVPGSALTTDLCATTDPPPVPAGNSNKFSSSLERLHMCLWTGKGDLGSYSVALQNKSSETKETGEQRDLDGRKVSEEIVTADTYPPSCKISWKHRQIDDANSEEMQVEYENFEKKLSNQELCANAEEYARRVLTKLPPAE